MVKGSRNGAISVVCEKCSKTFLKYKSEIKKHKRNFCSKICSDLVIPIENFSKRVCTHQSRHYAHDLAHRIFEEKCICGNTENLNVHHKDGNYKNNNPNNLIILCSSCHHKTDGRIRNIPKEKFGVGGKFAYMRLKDEYEAHRLSNGRFGGW